MVSVGAIMSVCLISKSKAERVCNCGIEGHETECCWEIDSEGILIISPGTDSDGNFYTNVRMKNFNETRPGFTTGYRESTVSSDAPWARLGAISVVVENGISNIGDSAFKGEKITSVNMPYITEVGYQAFEYVYALTSVIMPNVIQNGYQAFFGDSNLGYVELPATTHIGDSNAPANGNCIIDASGGYKVCSICNKSDSNGQFFQINNTGRGGTCVNTCADGYISNRGLCRKEPVCPDNCSNCTLLGKCTSCNDTYLLNEGGCLSAENCKNGFHADGGACVANTVANCNTEVYGKCIECNSGMLEQAGNCVSSCGEGYKQIENWCNRIRYTPAEAAKVLRDDNTNEVVLTFKK